MKNFIKSLHIFIFCLFLSNIYAQESPKEWQAHFKEVAKLPEYAGVDAVTTDKNGKASFILPIIQTGVSKEELSKKAHLILKNYLGKYMDEYNYDNEKDEDGDLLTQATGLLKFSAYQSFIWNFKVKFLVTFVASDGELAIAISDFKSSIHGEYKGVGGGHEDNFKDVNITTPGYAVNKKYTKVMNNLIGFQRVAIIDLKNLFFKMFNEKMQLPVSELENKSNW